MIRLLANRVQVTFSENAESAPYTRRATVWVDHYGHVDGRTEDLEWLIDQGYAEGQRVGPDDYEPFLTEAVRAHLVPQLTGLAGAAWTDLPEYDGG